VSPRVFGADEGTRELTALEMALNLAASVHRYARQSTDDQMSSYLNQGGERAHAAAQLAANLAVVSIAEDLHKLVSPWDRAAAAEEDGAVADARRTREHMRNWAAGEEQHPGEGTL